MASKEYKSNQGYQAIIKRYDMQTMEGLAKVNHLTNKIMNHLRVMIKCSLMFDSSLPPTHAHREALTFAFHVVDKLVEKKLARPKDMKNIRKVEMMNEA